MYLQKFDRSPMRDGPRNNFQLDVDVHLEIFKGYRNTGVVAIQSNFEKKYDEITVPVLLNRNTVESSHITVSLSIIISKDDVKLWWPNGMGEQHLYTIYVQYRDSSCGMKSQWIKKRIGENILIFNFFPC